MSSRPNEGRDAAINTMATAPVETVGPSRPISQTTVRNVTPAMTVPTDRVRWGPVWAGLLTSLFFLIALGLIGVAIGLTTINPAATARGGIGPNIDTNAAIWAGIDVIVSFIIGGFVAGRTAALRARGWAALNGALVFLLALPFILYLASQGLGVLVGNTGGIASNLGINLGNVTGSLHSLTPVQAHAAADTAKNTAWGAVIGLGIGILSGAIGGTLGMHREPHMTPPAGTVVEQR